MPINFDPNKYKQIDQQMLGPNAFNFNNNTAMLLSHAESLRKQLEGIISDRQRQLTRPKKTYQDAVNYISQNKDQFLQPDVKGGPKSGAYQIANEIRNDPVKQAQIKAQGYNVSDYIDALYAGLSGGQFRSEREYNQYVNGIKKDLKANPYQSNTNSQTKDKQQSRKKQNIFGEIVNTVEKPLHGFMNTFNEAMKVGKYNAQHYRPGQQPSQSLSKIAKDFKKGMNTQTSGSDVVKTLGVKNKTAQNVIGSSADLFMDPVNLIGLGVASKGAKLFNVAGKVEKGAKSLGAGDKLSKLAGISAKGGTITGGASAFQQGVDALANPGTQSLKQRLENVGFNTAIGAVGDPLLHGLFGGLRTPKTEVLPKQETLGLPSPKIAGLLNEGQRLALPEGKMVRTPRFASPTNPTSKDILGLPSANPSANEILDKLLPKIKPEVEQAMTPPFENPRELKKWIRSHTDIPVKQLDTLPPKDLTDIAIQVRNSLRLPDVAQEIAHKHGYDLSALLNGQVKDMNGVIARRNFAEAAGIPQNKLNMDILNNPQVGTTFKPRERFVPIDSKPLNVVGKNTKPLSLKVQPVIKDTPLNFSKKALMDKSLVNPLRTKLNPNQEVAATINKGPKALNISPKEGTKLAKATPFDGDISKILSNSDNWKDKPMPRLKRETMTRNFEDVMGKDAVQAKRALLDPIGRDEAKAVKWKDSIRNEVRKIGIKGNTKDSALAQMYGEGKVTLSELKQQTSNWKNVVKLTDHLRKVYNQVLPEMNKVLEKYGYAPVPFRKDYFPHMQDLTKFQKFLKDTVGIDFTDHTLPTDINGRTANFKPGKQFFSHALRRKGDQTAYDAIQGLDKYLEGASNVIFHTGNIKRLRSFVQALRNKYTDSKTLSHFTNELEKFTNMYAGKKVGFDHSTEDYTGRTIYNVVDNIRKRTASNMLAFNSSTALTSLIPGLTQAPALIGKKYFIKGMMDTLKNVVKKDGFETDFLTRREGSDPLYSSFWDNVNKKGFWLLKTLDKFSSQTIVRGKYNELIAKGVAPSEAKRQADELAAKILADRSKGQMPTLFADRTLSLLTQFQLEVNNQLSLMFKDVPRMSKNKAQVASKLGQIFLYSYLFNNMFEKLTGRRPSFDPLGVAINAVKNYTNDNISNQDASWNLIQDIANQLPFTSMFTGGRFPIEAGIPNVSSIMKNDSTWAKELSKPLTYLLPPTGGSEGKRIFQTFQDFGNQTPGYYRTDGKGNQHLRFPIQNSPSRMIQEGLFGRNSLPETNDFYNNKRRELTPKQTRTVENSSNPMQTFKNITQERRMNTLANQIRDLQKNKNMSDSTKAEKIREIANQIQKLKEKK